MYSTIRYITIACVFGLFLFSACNNKGDKNKALTIEWNPEIDSLLNDTIPISLIVDSIKQEIIHSKNDTSAIYYLNKLIQKHPSAKIEWIDEVILLSKKSKYSIGEINAYINKGILYSQQRMIDSAMLYFEKSFTLSNKKKYNWGIAKTDYGIAKAYYENEKYSKSKEYISKSIPTFRNSKNYFDLAESYLLLAYCYHKEEKHYIAIQNFEQAFAIFSKIKPANTNESAEIEIKQAECFYRMGNNYQWHGEFVSALNFYNKALLLQKEHQNKAAIASIYNSIGNSNVDMNNLNNALKYYHKALKLFKSAKKLQGQAMIYTNLSYIHYAQKEYEQSLKYANKCIEIDKKIKDEKGLSYPMSTIVDVYIDQKKYDKALPIQIETLRINQKYKNITETIGSYLRLGKIYSLMGNYELANKYIDSSLTITANTIPEINYYKSKSELYESWGNNINNKGLQLDYLNKSLRYFKKYKSLNDSIFSQDKIQDFAKSETKFEYEKKLESQKNREEKQRMYNEGERRKQQSILYSIVAISLLILFFSLILFNRLKFIRKQKRTIENQKKLVEDHQTEILDSINYAKRLQEAILPSESQLKTVFPESFLLYLPKDIVAGDFYWMEQIHQTIYIAVADATGHGVPGALVSIVCSNALNRAVNEYKLTASNKILDKTRELVLEAFSKSNSDVKDGMDISFMTIDLKEQVIRWSGANNNLWYTTNNELIEIVADKQPIGKTDHLTPFNQHTISFQKGNTFYLMTDGFADQFGGPKGKKYKHKQLKELLIANIDQEIEIQKEILEKSFYEWKGNLQQVDDVTIIGIRL